MENDVVLEIDGVKIGSDGQVFFRDRERVAMEWLVYKKHKGNLIPPK